MRNISKLTICFLCLARLVVPSAPFSAQVENPALLLIDIQEFYFPGGKSELENPVEASLKAAKLLDLFRKKRLPVIHVRHNSEPGGAIHENVRPVAGEKVVSKDQVNAFIGTDLLDYLKAKRVRSLVIAGMMTHMCVEAAVRAARDYGFDCTLVQDACATRALRYGDHEVSAADVHFATLSTLKAYAKVVDTDPFIASFEYSSQPVTKERSMAKPDLVGIVVKEMPRSLAFYRLLGLDIPAEADAEPHVEITLPGGFRIAWDTVEIVKGLLPDWREPSGHRMGLAFKCDSPGDVNRLYETLMKAGYRGLKPPWDAFWGQRYAIVVDPDGNLVDLFASL